MNNLIRYSLFIFYLLGQFTIAVLIALEDMHINPRVPYFLLIGSAD